MAIKRHRSLQPKSIPGSQSRGPNTLFRPQTHERFPDLRRLIGTDNKFHAIFTRVPGSAYRQPAKITTPIGTRVIRQ